jgi:hypothetical protein
MLCYKLNCDTVIHNQGTNRYNYIVITTFHWVYPIVLLVYVELVVKRCLVNKKMVLHG